MPLERLGPFKLEKLLGRGGMGAVYVGLNEETGARSAIKLLSGHLADDETFRERFKQEIETLKRLLHPHIVQLFGYGEEDGHLYYVMELVQGRSLQDELTMGRRFAWREVARLGIAIAQALKHAHDRGIIHRDLKPANLLIDAQDHVKLTDFGIAKLYGGASVTAEGGVLGTADYMAPEQSHGEQVTSRCDLYSLGSVLYALLTGKPPFSGKSVAEVVSALQKEKPIAVRRLAPDTPEEFEHIVLQLLEKDPEKRVPTALAVANRLKAMEHALSLETRIGGRGDGNEVEVNLPLSPHAAKTQIMSSASDLTAPLEADDDEYRLAGDAASKLTDASGSGAESRTELSTQASKKTGAGSDSGRGTHAERDPGTSRAVEPPAKLTRFVTVSEEELRGRREVEDSPLKQWLLAAALAVVGLAVLSGAVYLAVRRPSADRLYATAKAAADRGAPEELVSVEPELASFLESYPGDPRASEVKAWQESLHAYRAERQAALRQRRGELAEEMSPVQRAYHEAQRLATTDPEAALLRFEAIVAVFGDSAQADEHWVTLSRQQAARLTSEVQRLVAEEQAAINKQLERADTIASEDRDAARAIWRGLVTLYQDKAWARDLVRRAQERLDSMSHQE